MMQNANKYPWRQAWIIGASHGLGAELSRQLSENSIKTYLSGRNLPSLEKISNRLENSQAIQLDVTKQPDCENAIKAILEDNNILPDLIILNAAIYSPMNLETLDVNKITQMINVNFLGVVNMISALKNNISNDKKTTLVIVSSPSAWRGLPSGGGYGASKAAVTNFAESLKHDFEKYNVDLRLVSPGFIKTRLTDKNKFQMPQLMTAQFAAKKMLDGLKSKKFDIAFPNPFILLFRILRLLPNWLYFWLTRKM